jgi:ABC-type transport system substrate-binding protein
MKGENMRYLLLLILLVVVVSTAGCVGETSLNLFKPTPKPTPTPIPQDYSNCNGTWYDPYNQTCCKIHVFTRQAGFDCWGDQYLNSTMEILRENLDVQRQGCEQNGDLWFYTKTYSKNDDGGTFLLNEGGYCVDPSELYGG